MEGGAPRRVDGFCDSDDGSVYRIRFMPTKPGSYSYTATFRSGDLVFSKQGRFTARDARRPGVVRVDGQDPFHFIYEGTGAHYFWNSTTTYQILGWDDDTMLRSLERLARLGVNRIHDLAHASIVPCCANLLAALLGTGRAETTGEDNLKTLELVFGAYESARRGKVIGF